MFRRKNKEKANSVGPLPPKGAVAPGRASISSVASSSYIGAPPERMASITSIDSLGGGETIKSKRRSGFLGLGRSRKDSDSIMEEKPQVGQVWRLPQPPCLKRHRLQCVLTSVRLRLLLCQWSSAAAAKHAPECICSAKWPSSCRSPEWTRDYVSPDGPTAAADGGQL